MALKPEISIGVALATGTLVYAIYERSMPGVTDVRVAPAMDPHVSTSRKTAAWTAAGLVAGISLISRDPTVFIFGGALVVALDWWYRHANATDPATGMVSTPSLGMAPNPGGDLVPGMTGSMVS